MCAVVLGSYNIFSVDEIHSINVLSCGTIYYAVQGGCNFYFNV